MIISSSTFKVFKIIKTNRGIKSNPSNLDGKMNPLGFFALF